MIHINEFNENINEIARLFQIHEELTGNSPGRRSKVEILNKSGVVLLVACWEAFIEDLAVNAFEFLLANAQDHTAFSSKVLTQASRSLRDNKDERAVWSLADSGWRQVLEAHKSETLSKHIGTFNTPRPAQVNGLYEELLGLSNLSSNWHWQSMTQDSSKIRLDRLVTLRGDIAHRVKTSEAITKSTFKDNIFFVQKLGVTSHNAVNKFLYECVGEVPWEHVSVVK